MPLNLSRARAQVAKVMGGQCTIRRYDSNAAEQTFDPVTLKVTPSGDGEVVYRGPFHFIPRSSTAQGRFVAGQVGLDGATTGGDLYIEHDAPEIRSGDKATIDDGPDPQHIGRTMEVGESEFSSVVAWRRLSVSDIKTRRG